MDLLISQQMNQHTELAGRVSKLEQWKSRSVGIAIGAGVVISALYGLMWRVLSLVK